MKGIEFQQVYFGLESLAAAAGLNWSGATQHHKAIPHLYNYIRKVGVTKNKNGKFNLNLKFKEIVESLRP